VSNNPEEAFPVSLHEHKVNLWKLARTEALAAATGMGLKHGHVEVTSDRSYEITSCCSLPPTAWEIPERSRKTKKNKRMSFSVSSGCRQTSLALSFPQSLY